MQNTNGYLKRCVRPSCGALWEKLADHPTLVSCFRSDTPVDEPTPPGCAPSHPTPAPPAPSIAFNCSVSAARPDCNCSGQRPPFDAVHVARQRDFHYPPSESAERAALRVPELRGCAAGGASATLRDAAGDEVTLVVGGAAAAALAWGWRLLDVTVRPAGGCRAVMEFAFDEWTQLAFLTEGEAAAAAAPPRLVRMPVGRLAQIRQPLYAFESAAAGGDPDFGCKQDIDPTDFLATVAAAMSPGDDAEPTVEAAVSVLAPNTDSALLGNPEENAKWALAHDATLEAWVNFTRSSRTTGVVRVWSLQDHLPAGCAPSAGWANTKMGMAGRYLRVASQGLWSNASNSGGGGGCGAEVTAVAAFGTAANATSLAWLRLVVEDSREDSRGLASASAASTRNVTFFRVAVPQNATNASFAPSVTAFGATGGGQFYDAVEAQQLRWGGFAAAGAVVTSIPAADRRYADTALALLTMYQALDRGLVPQYGGGKFFNLYNVFLPLDTLALNGALLEWGHAPEAQRYLGHFFATKVSAVSGDIDYDLFGCDSDADYGRLVSTFCQALTYGGDLAWARGVLPTVHAMARRTLALRAAAVAAFPPGHPLHGIAAGSPEHDICRKPGYFFNVNAWHARGLLELGRLHQQWGAALSINATLEAALLPAGEAWRTAINSAADFTAVRSSSGSGSGSSSLFFLSDVVGSVYGTKINTSAATALRPGGNEADCLDRGTCFASMTAPMPNGGSNQTTNYANFRMFAETLLAGVLEPRFEVAIMSFRERHRGTLLGMTRFRDVLDDMPILGYGRAALSNDRLPSFHAVLAGHTLNYLSRGTHWGTEQRGQIGSPFPHAAAPKYRNDCGTGGEDCSLCMVSSVASSYWVRWMLVSAHDDDAVVYVARGAPRRWFAGGAAGGTFGVARAPTRLGSVSFELAPAVSGGSSRVAGWVVVDPNLGAPAAAARAERVVVRLRSSRKASPFMHVAVTTPGSDAVLVAWHPGNESAVFRLGSDRNFSFTASP